MAQAARSGTASDTPAQLGGPRPAARAGPPPRRARRQRRLRRAARPLPRAGAGTGTGTGAGGQDQGQLNTPCELTACRSTSADSAPSAASACSGSWWPATIRRPGLLDAAVARLDDIEARWSRFRPDSELSALNAHAGAPVFTSTDTASCGRHGRRGVAGHRRPLRPDRPSTPWWPAGYDRTFDDLAAAGDPDRRRPAPARRRRPGPAADRGRRAHRARRGARRLPPRPRAASARARAADLVTEQLLGAGRARCLRRSRRRRTGRRAHRRRWRRLDHRRRRPLRARAATSPTCASPGER